MTQQGQSDFFEDDNELGYLSVILRDNRAFSGLRNKQLPLWFLMRFTESVSLDFFVLYDCV